MTKMLALLIAFPLLVVAEEKEDINFMLEYNAQVTGAAFACGYDSEAKALMRSTLEFFAAYPRIPSSKLGAISRTFTELASGEMKLMGTPDSKSCAHWKERAKTLQLETDRKILNLGED